MTERWSTTKCPKLGDKQWTCTHEECVCHLKEQIKKSQVLSSYIYEFHPEEIKIKE